MLVCWQWQAKRKTIAQNAMNNLTGIDDESREELENNKQEATHQYQIVMQAHGKVLHQLAVKRNSIAKILWNTK